MYYSAIVAHGKEIVKMTQKQIDEINEEIELTELMIKDLEKLWKSYAKKALAAKQERELRQEKKGFMECDTLEELQDLYGYGGIDDETYHKGIKYFESLKLPPKQSIVERHRNRIKELLNREKGTLKELQNELEPPDTKQIENGFEAYDRMKHKERQDNLAFEEAMNSYFGERGGKA